MFTFCWWELGHIETKEVFRYKHEDVHNIPGLEKTKLNLCSLFPSSGCVSSSLEAHTQAYHCTSYTSLTNWSSHFPPHSEMGGRTKHICEYIPQFFASNSLGTTYQRNVILHMQKYPFLCLYKVTFFINCTIYSSCNFKALIGIGLRNWNTLMWFKKNGNENSNCTQDIYSNT
jgi:hypothetical protein